MKILGYELRKTCNACPEQYEVFKGEKQVGYLRLRHGSFTAEVPDVFGELVHESEPEGDGIFEDHERMTHLINAINCIDRYYKQFPHDTDAREENKQ